ncbi:MAG: glycosyltransferase family 4 protein [Bacteroidota bacterium]
MNNHRINSNNSKRQSLQTNSNTIEPTVTNSRKLAHFFYRIQAGGGQAGYLYNLHQLEQEDSSFCVVFNEKIDHRNKQETDLFVKFDRLYLPRFLKAFLHYFYYYLSLVFGLNLKRDYFVKLKEYDRIVFHSVKELAQFRRSRYFHSHQQLYTMLHTPVSFSEEHCDVVSTQHRTPWFYRFFLKRLSLQEIKQYELADGIIVACKAATSGYFYYNENLRNRFQQLPFYELASGLKALEIKTERTKMRENLSIKASEKAVCFVGRYNEHKGLDIYNKLVEKITAKHENIRFFSAGSGHLKPAGEVIENLGFRSDIADVIHAMDLIVNCNRYSYFDLLLLEAMSLGKAVLASDRGGNRCIAERTKGIQLFSIEHLDDAVDFIQNTTSEELYQMGIENYESFQKNFSEMPFYQRHENFAVKTQER